MKVFVPRRSQQKNEGNPPEPSVKSAKSLPNPPFGTFDQPERAQLQKKNTLEPNRDPTPTALSVLAKLSTQTAPDQPRPAPTSAVALEPLTIWAALHASIPECLEIIRKDGHLIAWLNIRTASKFWVSTPPVKADRATLERLVLTMAARNPDALIAALKSARGLDPDIDPARQEVAQRARFSRKEVTA